MVVATEQERQALDVAKKKKGRMDYFGVLGINIEEILTFSKDHLLICKVKENGQFLFKEELTTLSSSSFIIVSEMGYNRQLVQGAGCWCSLIKNTSFH